MGWETLSYLVKVATWGGEGVKILKKMATWFLDDPKMGIQVLMY